MAWTSAEEEQLRILHPIMRVKDIAEKMERIPEQVKTKIQRMGLKRTPGQSRLLRYKDAWLPCEDLLIRELYPFNAIYTFLHLLPGRTKSSVSARVFKLGLQRTEEQTELVSRQNRGSFKKGSVPANKGKKMSAEVKAKLQHTFFKKGHKPHNTKHDGAITVRTLSDGNQYKYIRISESSWELYHRHLWEKANGPVPEGMLVYFKDGNSMNCVIENLALLSLADNMNRNTIHRYPPELKQTIRLISKLKKKVRDAT